MSKPATRTRLAPAERKAQLLAVAADLFEREGYEDTSMERIAERAGVSPALVHHYFGSKRGAMLAVLGEAIAGFLGAVAPPGDSAEVPGDRWDRLQATLERYLTFIMLYPRGYAFATGSHGARDEEIRRRMADAQEHTLQLLLTQLELQPASPREEMLVWGWIGFVHATVVRWIDRPRIKRDELIAMLRDAARLLIESGGTLQAGTAAGERAPRGRNRANGRRGNPRAQQG